MKYSFSEKVSAILACIAFLLSVISLLLILSLRSVHGCDKAEEALKKDVYIQLAYRFKIHRLELEQKIDKIKKDTPVFIKHWDGTEFYVIFVENPKDAQPDVILVRVWGKVLPMEKALIKEIKEERK